MVKESILANYIEFQPHFYENGTLNKQIIILFSQSLHHNLQIIRKNAIFQR